MRIPLFFRKTLPLLAAAIFLVAMGAFGSDDAPRIEPQKLKESLNQPGLQLFDVRIVSDWKKSDRKIRGAVRVDPHDVNSWANKIPKEALVVVYCS